MRGMAVRRAARCSMTSAGACSSTVMSGTTIELAAHAGDRLSELRRQDSYSYQLASVHIGAADEAELTAKFEQVVAALPFEIDEDGP